MMRNGRAGVFLFGNSQLGVGVVVQVVNSQKLIAKEVNTGQLIEFERGQFHAFDSCGRNPNAADVVRNLAGVTVGSEYDLTPALPIENVIALTDFNPTSPTPKRKKHELTEHTVEINPILAKAIGQIVRQAMHKKKLGTTFTFTDEVAGQSRSKSKPKPKVTGRKSPASA
jgi:hypothetical protein